MLGLAGAAGIGYYLYQSGGNTKVAQEQFERRFPSWPLSEDGSLSGSDSLTRVFSPGR